jgi:hypothetical protein
MAGDSGGGHGATTGVWIAVALIIVGSIVSGIALIEWVWPVFWVGVGLMVLGCVLAYFADIMDMVTEFGSGEAPSEVESA